MKIYVASKFERVPQVREIQARLRAAGHEIVADWTSHSAAGLKGDQLTRKLRQCAEEDEAGVAAADAIVLLHDDNCRGGFVELGMALGRGKLVAVLGGRTAVPNRGPIFYALANVNHFDTIEAVIDWLAWTDGISEAPKVPPSKPEGRLARAARKLREGAGAVIDGSVSAAATVVDDDLKDLT